MAKKNSTATKLPMIFSSVVLINATNLVSFVNNLPKFRMSEEAFKRYMMSSFYFGGKFHGNDFIGGSNYSTVVRQLGLYHIINNEFIPRFYSSIDESIAESYLRYWLKLYVVPNPTSQSSLKKNNEHPKFLLKEIISFIQNNPTKSNIYDIVDEIFGQVLSRNDKGNLPGVLNKYSDCIEIDENNNVTLKPNYQQIMDEIDALINDPNRYFEHFGKGEAPSTVNEDCKQQIFYGAPGTGKSHTIKKEVDEKGKQNFRITFHPDSDYSTFVGAYKPSMKENIITKNGVETKEEQIVYRFVPQAFTKAYTAAWNTEDDVYLIIEEINRGNCAQIFGDLFQLLDRKNGVSQYPIDADTDLADYIAKELANSPRTDFPEKVKEGKKMVLPSNLYIWATMNTSDQSLFPIDSAFKRRWDWSYIPIRKSDMDKYKVMINGITYDWWSFVEQMNKVVEKATESEDKKMGYYFCKPDKPNDVISAKKFVSKVLFYLYNDVFKDNGLDWEMDGQPVFKYTDGENKEEVLTFAKYFKPNGNPDEKQVERLMTNLKVIQFVQDENPEEDTDSEEGG